MSLRLIFMGTPEFAVPTLRALAARGHRDRAVYTRAAKPAGRGMKAAATAWNRRRAHHNIPALTPTTLKSPEAEADFARTTQMQRWVCCLRHDPAKEYSRYSAARLFQFTRVAPALWRGARRSIAPTHERRPQKWRDGNENGCRS